MLPGLIDPPWLIHGHDGGVKYGMSFVKSKSDLFSTLSIVVFIYMCNSVSLDLRRTFLFIYDDI